jgi:hypothetical protein
MLATTAKARGIAGGSANKSPPGRPDGCRAQSFGAPLDRGMNLAPLQAEHAL